MADTTELVLAVSLDSSKAKEGLDSLENSSKKSAKNIEGEFTSLTDGIGKNFLALGTALAAAFTVSKIVSFLKSSAAAAIEAENANNALASSLAQVGKFSSEAVSSFSEYASALQATTGIGDDLIKQNAALLVSIGGLSGDGLKQGTKAALDLAQALQIDVGTAFDLVAKAASGNTGALGRYGLKLDESIPKGEKWAATLSLIQNRFGGLAETKLNTLEGSLTNLDNAFGEIQESIGGIFTGSGALRGAINFVAESFFKLSESIAGSIKGKDILQGLLSTLVQIAAVINNFVIAPIELFVNLFTLGLQSIKFALDTLVVGIVGFSKLLVESIVIPIQQVIRGIGSLVEIVDSGLGQGLKKGADNFKAFFTDPLDRELTKVGAIQDQTFNSLSENAENAFSLKATDNINNWLVGFQEAMDKASNSTAAFKNSAEINNAGVALSSTGLTEFLNAEELKRFNNKTTTDQLAVAGLTDFNSQLVAADVVLKSQLLAQEQQYKIDKAAVEKQFEGESLANTQARNSALQSLALTNASNVSLIEKRSAEDKLKLQKASDAAQFNNLKSSFSTIATLQESSSKELQAIGKAAAITNATIDGYAAVQKALASAPPPFNFAIAALVGVAAAANVAKIAGIGGGGGNSPSFDSGGGISSIPGPSTQITQPDPERQKPGTQVQLIVQGDIFDSNDTGLRLAEILNANFEKNGVVVQQGAFA
jgi:hypothetical protein